MPEVAHGCPKVVMWPRDNNLTIYETGRAGDGLAIIHRGEITKTARECQIEPGRVTVRYGFSGRVLLGAARQVRADHPARQHHRDRRQAREGREPTR